MFKLIDPKGAETEETLYMEPYYDIAKLSHSILGGYDYINHGLFDLSLGNDLNLALKLNNDDQVKLQQLFIHKLNQSGFNYRLVRLYESSLFLSMLPLHSDNLSKVLAFALRAAQILDELEA